MQWLKYFLLLPLLTLTLSACSEEPLLTDPSLTANKSTIQDAQWTIPWWEPRHNYKKQQAKIREVDLLMLGDSITHHFENTGEIIWDKYYKPRNAFNLGFSGDKTEHVLWRLQHGAIENMQPKLTVLMIGTNNTGHRIESAQDTARGIEAIVNELKKQLPNTKILLLGIFPREFLPENAMRLNNIAINKRIAKLHNGQNIFYLNLDHVFLDPDKILHKTSMPDFLHPNLHGYELWAKAMEPTIHELMQ